MLNLRFGNARTYLNGLVFLFSGLVKCPLALIPKSKKLLKKMKDEVYR